MSLSVLSSTANLKAAFNLAASPNGLNASLERLSTGLKINSGADDPAAFVTSQQQAAQVAGLNSAIQNTNATVNLVQTGQGALNQISSLLQNMRLAALDSANAGADDPTSPAADRAQIDNAANTIEKITQTTQAGGAALFSASTTAAGNPVTTATAAYGKQSQADLAAIANAVFTKASGPTSAVAAIDKAISDTNDLSGQLGAFQTNALQANANNLSISLQNTTSAESTVQDTDFAAEIAHFTTLQTQQQAGSTVLTNVNQTTQLIGKLLGG